MYDYDPEEKIPVWKQYMQEKRIKEAKIVAKSMGFDLHELNENKELTWYLLYGGESTDGRGFPKYESRTTDYKVALKHLKTIRKNPYSYGCVKAITDQTERIYFSSQEMQERENRT